MAMKRKATSQGGRAVKRFRRRPNIRRPLRRLGRVPKVHNFKRVVQLSTIDSNTSGNFGVFTFRLNQLPNVNEFLSLFDRYRIRGVQLKMVPFFTSADMNPQSTSVGVPNIHTVIDLNDAALPTSVSDLMEYDTYRMTKGLQGHRRYVQPRVSTEVYRSALTTSYGMSGRNMWFDCTTSGADIPHWAFKYAIDATATNAISWRVYATFYFQCVGTK